MLAEPITKLCLQIAELDDEVAFGHLFRYYYPGLLSFVQAILKSREPSEEAVEDVFLKLWENRKALPAINNLNYYLLVAAKHTALDYLEKMQKQAVINLDDVAFELGEMRVNPETTLISAETIRIIQTIIDGLPARCKLIFRLVKEDGLKYREVAELLNVSVKTVETQMSLALGKVGAALQSRLSSVHILYASGRKKQ
jgi:RNA polymerase sigma-70 factor (ECF subfamily)